MSFQSCRCIFSGHKLYLSQLHILILLLCVTVKTTTDMSNTERSFLMIKPDGVQRGLVGDIIKRFEAKGFKLVAMKFMWVRTYRINLTNLKFTLRKNCRRNGLSCCTIQKSSLTFYEHFRPRKSCWRTTTLT